MKHLRFALVGALAVAAAFMGAPAFAGVFDGYVADCTAVTSTSCTEITTTGYNRQAVTMNGIAGGVVVNGNYFTFSQAGTGGATIAGRAIYDAVTGGNLLAVIPVATALVLPTYGDRVDVGGLKFTLTGYSAVLNADAITANWAAGASIGTTADGSTVSPGVPVQMVRGKALAYPGDYDPIYSVGNTQVTGFSVAIPNGTSTYGISGAGTLAAGTIALQAAPTEGEVQRIECDVTVTALTITVPSGYAAIGTLPTTCGANAAHWLQYFVAAHKVRVLF